jgi:hypothetical protein
MRAQLVLMRCSTTMCGHIKAIGTSSLQLSCKYMAYMTTVHDTSRWRAAAEELQLQLSHHLALVTLQFCTVSCKCIVSLPLLNSVYTCMFVCMRGESSS